MKSTFRIEDDELAFKAFSHNINAIAYMSDHCKTLFNKNVFLTQVINQHNRTDNLRKCVLSSVNFDKLPQNFKDDPEILAALLDTNRDFIENIPIEFFNNERIRSIINKCDNDQDGKNVLDVVCRILNVQKLKKILDITQDKIVPLTKRGCDNVFHALCEEYEYEYLNKNETNKLKILEMFELLMSKNLNMLKQSNTKKELPIDKIMDVNAKNSLTKRLQIIERKISGTNGWFFW